MKNLKIIGGFGKVVALVALLGTAPSCEITPVPDPNNPSLVTITDDPTRSEIQNLVDGILAAMRLRLGTYYDAVGVVGREYYRFSASDPRFTSDLLGKGEAVLDDNTFYTTGPFAARHRAIQNCIILMEGAATSTALTPAEVTAVNGFARTVMAHEFLLVWVQQYTNGIRFYTSREEEESTAGFLDSDGSLQAIADLLDEADADLTSSSEFPFSIDAGVGIPGFNRALAARVAVYLEDWDGALDALDASFHNEAGAMDMGFYLPFSAMAGDELNPMWFPRNADGETRVAHPDFVSAMDTANDLRFGKVAFRDAPAFSDNLESDWDLTIYASNASPLPMIRNEELILIAAEAHAQLGNAEATDAIDAVRAAAGLGAYSGGTGTNALIDEILMQRRFSLIGEGHRWVDMRRYDRLDELPIDRAGDDVFSEFPRPQTEA